MTAIWGVLWGSYDNTILFKNFFEWSYGGSPFYLKFCDFWYFLIWYIPWKKYWNFFLIPASHAIFSK